MFNSTHDENQRGDERGGDFLEITSCLKRDGVRSTTENKRQMSCSECGPHMIYGSSRIHESGFGVKCWAKVSSPLFKKDENNDVSSTPERSLSRKSPNVLQLTPGLFVKQ